MEIIFGVVIVFIFWLFIKPKNKIHSKNELNVNKPKESNMNDYFAKGYSAWQKQNYHQAVEWYTIAAEQGHEEAQINLGNMLISNEAIILSEDAFKWINKAAENGTVETQFKLARRYHKGVILSQDFKQAAKWYTIAAEHGFKSAQYQLALMYKNGEGVPQDSRQVIKWLKKAAEQSHVGAQNTLINMYYEGQGVPQDYKQAYIWAALAVMITKNREDTTKKRDVIAKELVSSELKEAQDLSTKLYNRIT